ncbi:uncharacterized protein SCHCODRAFT_02622185 [Schizophyllum commune H4-8]|uniref:Uncharacterized protein n=1 Tax=Schizophyllum commune (strain H4-8 / FGSC 9210) TaxID=578458 RepID=D8PQE4_SCHCM|nr:uncharacterized protein SCHCODRAFT_02622185 [Schizophyllum commune H4-8]KAI5893578.1 hypothetical protein SCHCODRAFT_02622185 [Schizophyllum commune H4-8]
MKLLHGLSLLALLSSVSAQYFSEGWDPSKPIPTSSYGKAKPAAAEGEAAASAPADEPLTPSKLFSYLDSEKLLHTKPAQYLFEKLGMNITEKLDQAKGIWDDRIQLITDDNYEELIVNEPLTEEEEHERVWCIVISTTAAKHDAVSKFVDEQFDIAYNDTLIAEDLPHVQWGRIDYLNVTYLTTKWNVWSGPWIVIAKERGKVLRFYRTGLLHMRNGGLREMLRDKAYESYPPWNSSFGPGGDYEQYMHYWAQFNLLLHTYLSMIPRWMAFILSGTVASLFMQLLHRGDKTPKVPKAPAVKPVAAPAEPTAKPEAKTTSSKAGKSNAKQRKNKK